MKNKHLGSNFDEWLKQEGLMSDNKKGKVRDFGTGATRDTDDGKLDYEGFYSPLVMKRYSQYMNKHRVQSDGGLRDSDNWQNLFGPDHFAVCMKSGMRHFMDWWTQHRGYPGQDTLEESLCALLFNVQAYLFKILKDKEERNSEEWVEAQNLKGKNHER